jgi:predicted dehydrogenase
VTEKPIALDLADAKAMAKAGERAGVHVLVAQNYRFRRQSRALQQLVADGTLGELLGIRISCRRDTFDSFIAPGDWRARMAHPYLIDMAIHHVDMLRMITGRELAEVDARGWHVPDHPFDAEPSIEALITVADGTPVAYEGTFAAAGTQTSWNGDWELVGTEARATWTGGVVNPLRGTVTLQRYRKAPARVPLPVLPALDRVGVLEELRLAVLEGRPPEVSAADNLRTFAAVLAIARSIDERRPVKL